jgi:hypothetical protein
MHASVIAATLVGMRVPAAGMGQLGPDLLPVVGAKVASRELAVALLFNASAVGNRDAVPPAVDGLARKTEATRQRSLKAGTVEQDGPVVFCHTRSMV